jgi:hypothetical protein
LGYGSQQLQESGHLFVGQAVTYPIPLPASFHQSGLLEHCQVLRDVRLAAVQNQAQVIHVLISVSQYVQDVQANGMRQSLKEASQPAVAIHHPLLPFHLSLVSQSVSP